MENLSLFDYWETPLKINKPIRLIELFAGIGSQAKALKRLGADFEHYRICEFDKYAIKSYNAIHGTDFTTSDITKIVAEDLGIVDTDKYCYIMTYSFPCQDLSLAGKQRGMAKGENTRSGLLWEVERLLNECKELPQILLMENVTQVHGKKNKEHFDEWIGFLESKGYTNYWKDLNAKNFGIPQNRNRTFMVSVLGRYKYEFPEEFPLELRLKDMLEDSVDEKFYLSEKMINFFKENTKKQQEKGNGFKFSPTNGDCIGKAVTTRAGGRMDDNFIEEQPTLIGGMQKNQAIKKDGISTTLTSSMGMGGGYVPMVTDSLPCYTRGKQIASTIRATIHKQGSRNLMQNFENGLGYEGVVEPFIVRSQGRNPENPSDRRAGIHTEQRLEPNFSGCSNTLTTVQKDNYIAEPVIIQKYGDRGTNQYSVRDYAHTIPANPMSDRVQMVVEPQSCLIQPKDRNYKLKNQVRETHIEIKDDGISHALRTNAQTMVSEPLAYDEQNGYIRKDGTVGTLTTDGSSPKHNNRVIENCYVSEKGVKFICSPKRGMATDVNADVCQPLTAKGQANWTGSFISPDIETLEKSTTIGSAEPTKIHLKNGEMITSDDNLFGLRIRKLTPKECWRLMGFDDADFEKAAAVNSNSQLYKQAGNSIVVDVLCYIFREML